MKTIQHRLSIRILNPFPTTGPVRPPHGSGYDIGAHEFDGQLPSPSSTPLPTHTPTPISWPIVNNASADINEDGYVDYEDMMELQQNWHKWSITPTPKQ